MEVEKYAILLLVKSVKHTYIHIYIYIYIYTLLSNHTGWVLGKKGYYFCMKKKNDIEINITKFYYLESNALFISFF